MTVGIMCFVISAQSTYHEPGKAVKWVKDAAKVRKQKHIK